MSNRPRTSYLIRRVQLLVYASLSECLRQHRLTPMQYMLLSLSRRGGEMSSADLARRFAITPQSMNEKIATLQRKRLIVRHVSSEHRRILRISLTAQGARLLKVCDREVDAMEDRLFAALTPPALEALRNAPITLGGRSGAVKKTRRDARPHREERLGLPRDLRVVEPDDLTSVSDES